MDQNYKHCIIFVSLLTENIWNTFGESSKDIMFLFCFTFQELNVRQLTLSTDKDKYGIRLRAEPDHMVLGKRLKGAFKAITASIKELTSEQLETFQKTGISVCLSTYVHNTTFEPTTWWPPLVYKRSTSLQQHWCTLANKISELFCVFVSWPHIPKT